MLVTWRHAAGRQPGSLASPGCRSPPWHCHPPCHLQAPWHLHASWHLHAPSQGTESVPYKVTASKGPSTQVRSPRAVYAVLLQHQFCDNLRFFYVVTFSAINSIYSKEILFEKEAFLAQESSKTAHFVANFLNNVLKAFFLGKFLGKSCKFCHPGTALHLCTFPVSHLDTLLHLGCFAF